MSNEIMEKLLQKCPAGNTFALLTSDIQKLSIKNICDVFSNLPDIISVILITDDAKILQKRNFLEMIQIIKSMPEKTNRLCLHKCGLGKLKLNEFISVLKSLPKNLYWLDLPSNELHKLLEGIEYSVWVKYLPQSIKVMQLKKNSLSSKPKNTLSDINKSLIIEF